MAEIVNLGSLYLNGQPKDLGVKYNGEVLSFGNTNSERSIPFVKWGELLVANQCVCVNISWDELNKAGYIFGCPVKINGTPYICRSLKVGKNKEASNEWDSILDTLGEYNSILHWEKKYFWGQEGPNLEGWESFRAVRGYCSARYWYTYTSAAQLIDVGFRPVLKPLPPEPLISDALIRADLKVYGPDTAIIGQLVEYTDYDLVMAPNTKLRLPRKCQWARRDGKRIIIDRAAIVWMKEE